MRGSLCHVATTKVKLWLYFTVIVPSMVEAAGEISFTVMYIQWMGQTP